MKAVRALTVVLGAICLTTGTAEADPITFASDGTPVFHASLTTEATFQCLQRLSPFCQGLGTNAITLGTGADTTTITFSGVEAPVAIGNVTTPVIVGRLTMTTTGTGFAYPDRLNPNVGVLAMNFILTHDTPVAATRVKHWIFIPRGSDLEMFMGSTYTSFPLGANPPGFNYPAAVYTFTQVPFRISPGGTFDIMADVGAVPEPATVALVGSGIAALVLRRRRRGAREADARPPA